MQTTFFSGAFRIIVWMLLLLNTAVGPAVFALSSRTDLIDTQQFIENLDVDTQAALSTHQWLDYIDNQIQEESKFENTQEWEQQTWSEQSHDFDFDYPDYDELVPEDEMMTEGNSWLWQSDPTILISCIPQWEQFDLDNLTPLSEFSCWEAVLCAAWFKNEWWYDTEDFLGTFTVNWWTINHQLTATTPWITCDQTSDTSYSCSGVVTPTNPEDIFVFVDLPDCECDESGSFTVEWSVFASNDSNNSNNSDTHTVLFEWEVCESETVCLETIVNPAEVVLNNDDFQVTCIWEHADSFTVSVTNTQTGQNIATSPELPAVNNQATWTFIPTQTWSYEFICEATWSENSDQCPWALWNVIPCWVVCECTDPISLSVTSHTNGQTVFTSSVILSWEISPENTQVFLNGNPVQVSWNSWSTEVTLQQWVNILTLSASNDDPLCDVMQTFVLYLGTQPETVCLETIVTPSHVVLDQWNFHITCLGQNVDKFMVSVLDADTQQEIALSPDLIAVNNQASWTYIPTQPWNYEFICLAWWPYDDVACPSGFGTVISPNVCEDPIQNLTLDSHIDWQTVNTETVSLFGTVTPWNISVTVNWVRATVTWTSWFVDLDLTVWANLIEVVALSDDPLCEPEYITIILYYQPDEVVCIDTDLTPSVVELWDGSFTVTCTWANADYFTVSVTQNGQQVAMSDQLFDTDWDGQESWVWTPSVWWEYNFTCTAHNNFGQEICPTVGWTVVQWDICEAPITTLSVDNYQSWVTVQTNTILLQWIVNPWDATVQIQLPNGQIILANISWLSWTAVIPLQRWVNNLEITALPADQFCDPETLTFVVIAEEPAVPECVAPISVLTVDSHVSWETVIGNSVQLAWTVEPWTATVFIRLANWQIVQATVLWNTWTATIPLNLWLNNFMVIANPEDIYCEKEVLPFTLFATEQPIVTKCLETNVYPPELELLQWSFEVTCVWENVDKFMVQVENATTWQTVANSGELVAEDDQATWTWTPTAAWTYTFTCVAWWPNDDVACPAATWVVTSPHTPVCEEPIETLTVDSHVSWEIVNSNVITLSWTVEPWTASIHIKLSTWQIIQASIVWNTWSTLIPLQVWNNSLTIIATPLDSLCAPLDIQFSVQYNPDDQPSTSVCLDTTVSPASVILWTSWNFLVTCTWENIDQFIVTVKRNWVILWNSPVLVDTDGNDMETWQYTPLQTWNYEFICTGMTDWVDYICPAWTWTVSATWEVCEDPIWLVITSPANDTTSSSNNVLVTGTVQDLTAEVRVNDQLVTVDSQWRFEIELTYTTNWRYTITATARNNDVRCNEEVAVVYSRVRYAWWSVSSIPTPVCGNGIVEVWEQCDDWNLIDWDGCSSTCQLEENIVIDRIEEREREIEDRVILRPEPIVFRPIETPAILPQTWRLERFAPSRRLLLP